MRGRKYGYALGLGFKEAMAYRGDYWLSMFSAAFPITIQVFVWQAVYGGTGETEVFGRTHAGMIGYTVCAAMLWRLLRTGFEYDINDDIKNGGLSKYVVRPVSYLPYRMCCFLGGKLGFVLGGLVLLSAALMGVGLAFHEAPVALPGVLCFFPALALAYVLNFLIFFCVGMWAFWLSEIGFLFEAVRIVIVVLSGGIFPLDIFGGTFQSILACLPFSYTVGFPVDVLTGTVKGTQVFFGLGVQMVWILLMLAAAGLLWRRGTRRYLAAGG